MFVFLAIFIIFVLILNHYIRKSNRSHEDTREDFWEREQKANFARRKDISNLNYLTIPLQKIPQNLHTDSEKKLVNLASCQMLNLNGKTNTDLKMEYGAANLDALWEYDNNFSEFVQTVPVYASELVDAGQTDDACALLELAISYGADSSKIYTQLADLYEQSGRTEKIKELADQASKLPSMEKNLILGKLNAYLP